MITRQTSKATFKEMERHIRQHPEIIKYIRQTYPMHTVIRQITDKQWHDDVLKTKANALAAGCQLKNWYTCFPVK